ncbi:MAG TPA: hypothetical protein VFW17_15185 [Ktedonobacterales bacterium]|nr:hypothetical protein [Ktedonobacterales bacterium]
MMPLQNRVTPFGNLIATPERGLMFGNRGVLHNEERRIVRYNQGRRWIACRLEFRGWHREVMPPHSFTGLFFLDEATALAAGHRPCAECRYQDYQRFRQNWCAGGNEPSGALPSADQMDAQLHQDRLEAPRTKRLYHDQIAALPDGVIILREGEPWLLWQSALHHWTPGGYDRHIPRPADGDVAILTPRAMVRTIAAGYVPAVHPSAQPDRG